MKKKVLWFSPIICILVALVVFLLASHFTPFMMDDLWYSTNLSIGDPATGDFGPSISSVKDIYESQVWHYFNWGGRTVAHTILQFLLWSGENAADIFNTIALSVLCVFMVQRKKKIDLWMVILAFGMLISCNPNWHDTLLWQASTANYLYTSLICLPFIAFYLGALEKEKKEEKNIAVKILLPVGMFVWGVLSGWTNENIGPTVFLVTAAVIYFCIKEGKARIWMYAGSVGTVIGSALMILAPGNSVRNQFSEESGNLIRRMIIRAMTLFDNSDKKLFPIFIVLLFTYILFRLVMKKRPAREVYIIMGACIVSNLAFLLSPQYPDRAGFGTAAFGIWGSLKMLGEIFENEETKKMKILTSIFFWTASVTLLGIYIAQQT